MTDRELMQQALDVLQAVRDTPASKDEIQRAWIVSDLLQRRLAQPEQEPFGYFRYDIRLDSWVQNREGRPGTPFYTTPPQRTWVGLTDEEKAELDAEHGDDTLAHLDAIESKLREKNT